MNIGRSDIDWKSLSHNEIDRIIAERIEADNKRIEANGGKKSKRAGYILERIAEINNLREADKEAQDGKVKKNRFIRRHNLHPEEDLRALQLMILTLDFPAPDYSVMRVKSDAGKVKRIKSRKRNREIRASYWGWCKWGDCKNLWRTITNNDMSLQIKVSNRVVEQRTERSSSM